MPLSNSPAPLCILAFFFLPYCSGFTVIPLFPAAADSSDKATVHHLPCDRWQTDKNRHLLHPTRARYFSPVLEEKSFFTVIVCEPQGSWLGPLRFCYHVWSEAGKPTETHRLWVLSPRLQSVTQINVHQEEIQLVQPEWCWQSWREVEDISGA